MINVLGKNIMNALDAEVIENLLKEFVNVKKINKKILNKTVNKKKEILEHLIF